MKKGKFIISIICIFAIMLVSVSTFIHLFGEEDINENRDTASTNLFSWVVLDRNAKKDYIIGSSGVEQDASSFYGEYSIFNVEDVEKVVISGYKFTTPSLYYFCDASGNVIEQGDSFEKGAVENLELSVPENATVIKVNGHQLETIAEAQVYKLVDSDEFRIMKELRGKKFITLGDSITALDTYKRGWLKYFVEKTGCEIIANVAVNGAGLKDRDSTFVYDGAPQQGEGNDPSNVLGNQVEKIIRDNYEVPDFIMIMIGTNGGIDITEEDIEGAYYDTDGNLIPLEEVDRTTDAGAYRWSLEKLQEKYPDAVIFWCTPIEAAEVKISADVIAKTVESLRVATSYTNQIMIDTVSCGIDGANEIDGYGQDLYDGIHPSIYGAQKMGFYNANKVYLYFVNL